MKAFITVDDDLIGEVDFSIIDEAMGAIGGNLIPYPAYEKYKVRIQTLYNKNGIANIDDFNFKIILEDHTQLHPQGGIGITHSTEFEEIYVESAGLESNDWQKIMKTIML